ncbi:MAG: hypothetical protein IPN02_03910 [Candidatus Microthrix sp.]|uniref:Uncharacterized protein n=1 Tax=Candidatus Neomicrothrix subdominans TaxID=2954438 RepID=A0A936NAR0_9ACTN|nr:hypothetical protein [Candidatus Microthrix subdominans]
MLDKFDVTTQIDRLDRSKLRYLVVSKFAEIDLHPDKVSSGLLRRVCKPGAIKTIYDSACGTGQSKYQRGFGLCPSRTEPPATE